VSERRRGLGRGLGALIPAPPTEKAVTPPAVSGAASPSPSVVSMLPNERGATLPTVSREAEEASVHGTAAVPAPPMGAYFAEIPLDAITPNPRQPREVFDEDALSELITSIKEVGLLQPVVVRQVGPASY
jgi:ParB family chromosome partitioning protein